MTICGLARGGRGVILRDDSRIGSREDECAPAGAYAAVMQPLRSLIVRLRALDPLRADLLLAVAFLIEAELEVLVFVRGYPHAGLAAVIMVAIAAGLALRRRAPVVAIASTVAAIMAIQPLGRGVNDHIYVPVFVALFMLYSTGRHADERGALIGFVIAAAGFAITPALDDYPSTLADYTLGPVVIGGGPILLGRVIRNRTRLNRTLREKAESLRRQRAHQAEQAAVDERTRIAGELHDVVAHAMSAMVVQAAGARRLAAKDAERARDAFAAVETTGREALTEIRRMLGVLRREDEQIALAPQPSLRHLSALLDRTRAAGLPVDLAVEGGQRDLPAGVDLTAYRLIQEALGGAVEQGAAGRAQVTVRYRPDVLDVEVSDDGAAEDGGRQLMGVSERVSLYGGHLETSRHRTGGHTVRARLPVGGAS
jgi:signal transduction histidine kinase